MAGYVSASSSGEPDDARVWEELVAAATDPPWYAAPVASVAERRRELQQERSRLLARSIGGHLPYELALRVAELDAQLAGET